MEASRLGRKWWKEGKLPNGKLLGSKQIGEKVEEQEKLPNRKLLGSKQIGEKVVEQEKLPNGRQYMPDPEQGRLGRKWWNE